MLKAILLIGLVGMLSACTELNQSKDTQFRHDDLNIGKKIDNLGNRVSRIFQDSQNNYWFAHEGVVKYDGTTFIQYTINDGLYANRVRDIQEDHEGNIFFDTGEGINKFDGKTIEKLTVTDDSRKAKMLTENDLWFAGTWTMNGVYRYDGENLYHLKLPKHKLEDEAKRNTLSSSYQLYANYTTFKDDRNKAWIGNSTFGACRFDGKDFFWVSEREMTEIDPGPSMGVRSIAQDEEGNFYFASNVNSKYRISQVDGEPKYEKLPGVPTSINPDIDSACISIAIDGHNNIWMAHYQGGVWKYDGKSFTHFPILINNEEAEVFSIYIDRNEKLWIGTHNAGAWEFIDEQFTRFEGKDTQ